MTDSRAESVLGFFFLIIECFKDFPSQQDAYILLM